MIYLDANSGWIVFVIVLGITALIALIAFLIYLYMRPKLKKDDKPTEEEIAEEEMKRILEPITDEETAKAVTEYKDEDD